MCDVLTAAMAADETKPAYGGQAVLEGVMMRGGDLWALAVRRPDGSIVVEHHEVGGLAARIEWLRRPLVRGAYALGASMRVGVQALFASARHAVDEGDRQLGPLQMAGAMTYAILSAITLFVILPNLGTTGAARWLEPIREGLGYHVTESILRMVVFALYLLGVSRMAQIRRTFEYHGAEHQTITAWETGDELDPTGVGVHTTKHVRCGTNFLLLVMVVSTVIYTLVGLVVPAPDGGGAALTYQIGMRIVLLPVVAGVTYEILRLGAARIDDSRFWRALMAPGLALQSITTRRPDDAQREVAIQAFVAVVPAADLVGRVDEAALTSAVEHLHPTPREVAPAPVV